MQSLKRKELFCTKNFIHGDWIESSDKKTISVDNPATLQNIGTVPNCGEKEALQAIDSSYDAWLTWKKLTPKERGVHILKWANLIEENIDDLARILTIEQGKPLVEARGEILAGTPYFSWFVEEARRAFGQVVPAPRHGVRPVTFHEPVGPVFSVTPWNFPSSMILRKAAAALAAGCTMLIKPASATPYSALALMKLAEEAGMPKGVLNMITGSASVIADVACASSKIRKVSFTGSTEVGKLLMANASKTMKRTSMELGGNAPFIVFDDANLETTINCAIGSKFRNAGQTCICANRFLIQKGIYDKFVQAFSARIDTLKCGNGLEEGSIVGPLINQAAIDNMKRLVADASAKGASILKGGKPHSLGGLFFEPTLMTGVTKEMLIFQEEIFGPLAGLMTFETEEEAIALANDTKVGLASYVMTTDLGRSWRMAENLEYGMVGINDVTMAMPEVPFGGIKESGMGREGSHEGLMDYMETRYALMGI